MRSNMAIILLTIIIVLCELVTAEKQYDLEGRGRKKKKEIALFVYIADIILKKLFVLKIIYAFAFWVVIHKAGYFLAWFVSYLKEQKNNEHKHHHYPDHPHHGYDYYKRKKFY